MKFLPMFCAAAAAIGALTLNASDASAASCKNPVIIVHGRGLTAKTKSFDAIVSRLQKNGYCVDRNFLWGKWNGKHGYGDLTSGANALKSKVDAALRSTGAKKVSLVSHSAGQGVVDYYLQKLGGNQKVHANVSFAGLHHPYAYVAIPNIIDLEIYIPALSVVMPVVDAARFLVGLFDDVATSPFVSNLFNEGYWRNLQGNHPANPVVLPTFGNGVPTIYSRTNDAASGVCYMNLTSPGDALVSRIAGRQFKKKGNGIDYQNRSVGGDHTSILWEKGALNAMVTGLKRCGGGSSTGPVNPY